MRVLAFGDSITYGKWDIDGGWADRLRKYYDQKAIKNSSRDFPNVYNLGISGDKTVDILQRFENETKVRLEDDLVFIFAVGVNDSRIENGSEISTTDIYRTQLEKLIAEAKRFSDKILFVGLTPVEENKTTPVYWRDTHYINERIFLFENVMRDECIKHHVPHVAVLEELQDRIIAGEELLADGLHPNNDGHELIFKLVRPELDKLLAA